MKNKCIVKKAFFSKILFENPVPLNMHLRMHPRSATVEKMADIFTKRIFQPYLYRRCIWPKLVKFVYRNNWQSAAQNRFIDRLICYWLLSQAQLG